MRHATTLNRVTQPGMLADPRPAGRQAGDAAAARERRSYRRVNASTEGAAYRGRLGYRQRAQTAE